MRKRDINSPIKDIYKLIMRPLEQYKPASVALLDFYEILFQTNKVKIYKRELTEDFRPVGTIVKGHTYQPQNETLLKGTKIFIREDLNDPEHVDAEFITEDRNSNQPQSIWYKMTKRNFRILRRSTRALGVMLCFMLLAACSAKRERTVIHYTMQPREVFDLEGKPCEQTGYEINEHRNQVIIYYKGCAVRLKGDLRAR